MIQPATTRAENWSIAVIVVMTLAGAAWAPSVFPDLALWRAVLGGALLGGFSALCAVMHRFFE